jgi:hypothetical protein
MLRQVVVDVVENKQSHKGHKEGWFLKGIER